MGGATGATTKQRKTSGSVVIKAMSVPADKRVLNDGATEMVPVTLLQPHPRNPRQGDLGAVMESISANGFYGALIVQKGSCYILAGNHRYLGARALGYTELPVIWLDVDDEEALRILLVDNATSDKGTYNTETLAQLLTELQTNTIDELAGTGYTGDDLDDLLKGLARGATSSEPEPEKPKGEESLAIILLCDNASEQGHLHDKLKSMGYYPRKTTLNERTQLAVGSA